MKMGHLSFQNRWLIHRTQYGNAMHLCLVIICTIIFGIHGSVAQVHADIRGTNDDTDGGVLQIATPSENHFLRLFGGQNTDARPYLYFSSMDTFRIANGLSDYSNFTERLTILPNGFVGINTSTPQSALHANGDITTPWASKFYHYEPNWTFKKQIYLAKSWNGDLWDYLYLGATGGRDNAEQAALILSGKKGILLGRGHNDGSMLSKKHVQIDTAGRMGIGTTEPQAALDVSGFSILGKDAPKIKMEKVMGTMPIGAGNFESVRHGIGDKTKILGVHIFVDRGRGNDIPPGVHGTGFPDDFYYIYTIHDASIDLINRTGAVDAIGGLPVRILIIYEE